MDLMSLAEMHQRPEDPYLPPGFRFHPTDEEIVYYLTRKVLFSNFRISAITEVDLNKCEPWDLPGKATMGEKEWYFYTLRDRKYPTGMRTNRATEAGYWKATGKDRNVTSSRTSSLVGMKKTLVFYRGRAPKGVKSNWIMHEYRLEGEASHLNRQAKMPKDAEWVVCRIFQKVPGGKNGRDSGSKKNHHFSSATAAEGPTLPPLMEEPTRVTVTEEGAADSDSSQNDQFGPGSGSFSGNSYSMLKEQQQQQQSNNTTSSILQQQNPTAEAPNRPFFAPVPTLEHAYSSYPPSAFTTVKYPRPPEFHFMSATAHDPVPSSEITSLKALDQFSRALAGPFSIGKVGIRACKVEPRVETRTTPGFQPGFRPPSLDTSVAGWLAENQNLSFCNTLHIQQAHHHQHHQQQQQHPQQHPQQQNYTPDAPAGHHAETTALNLYRLVPPSASTGGEMESMWNY